MTARTLRDWRRIRRVTQKELAKKAGLTQGFISQIETGGIIPKLDDAQAIAKALEVGLDAIAWGKKCMK